ncbi:glycosyltransferase family 2 protein [Desertivirga arenae]|uniref:glycosyltransferase family 2 protein n=1 Tax=Desertivirga arenae TaxID=2810309 RepID=UPI001A958218|nr:glycosyltransferase family A protein [Pedobacter sp. SYSU D00823]
MEDLDFKAHLSSVTKFQYGLLVPCYNASRYVNDFVATIENQTKRFDEVIFFDDYSTDNTVQLLENAGYKVLKGIRNEGPSFARNALANATNCTYFHFHDIDDFLHPDYLLKTSQIAEEKEVDVILCNVDWLDNSKQKTLISWKYSNRLINLDAINYTISHPIGGINGLYKKLAFNNINGFNSNIKLWEDADLHVRLALNNSKFHVIEEVLSFAVRGDNTLSSNQRKAWITRVNLLRDYFNKHRSQINLQVIGYEAQKAAFQLALLQDFKKSKEAFLLSEQCGVSVPDKQTSIWKLFHKLPAWLRIELRVLQLRIAFRKNRE